ncbi:MAG TPA: hypothetical protein VMY36_00030 [Patescibacteria group bacterium]|nr:hypothetical protein [Patescibacteria group bacterium]
MIITIVAFRDDQARSVAYKKFDTTLIPYVTIEEAVKFYKKMIEKKDVKVISTRIVKK